MKTSCNSCGQKYSIPDEKCTGQVLRVRCSKCRDVMKVVGPTDQFSPSKDTAPPALALTCQPDAIEVDGTKWWCGIDGRPHGPYSKQDLVSLAHRGDVNGRTYLWHAGMTGWARACESPALGFVLTAVLAAAKHNPAFDVFAQASLATDGRGYFADPTMKSGFLILDARAQEYLETCAQLAAQPVRKKRSWLASSSFAVMIIGFVCAIAGTMLLGGEQVAKVALL